jgi:hypothetical protein
VFRIPLATRGNLEDWGCLLSTPSPVRRAVEAELGDRESGIWGIFDPDALRACLPPLGVIPGRGAGACVSRGVKRAARAVLRLVPAVERPLVVRAHEAGLRVDQLFLRVLVLKAWYDLFVFGGGSRREMEQRAARAA